MVKQIKPLGRFCSGGFHYFLFIALNTCFISSMSSSVGIAGSLAASSLSHGNAMRSFGLNIPFFAKSTYGMAPIIRYACQRTALHMSR